MTNRKLKKKIRQAFQHATPDLAGKIAVDSLFSDVTLKKAAEPARKPLKTPIQFRATATLAASIAVVALLVGLLPKANPIGPSGAPDATTGQVQTGTLPGSSETYGDPLTPPDKVIIDDSIIDPEYSMADLQRIKDLIYAAVNIPFPAENANMGATLSSWNQRQYYTATLSDQNNDPDSALHFLIDVETNTVHLYDPELDISKYLNTYFRELSNADDFAYRIVLADNKVCYAMAADYALLGEFILLDAKTEQVVSRQSLVGSVFVRSAIAEGNNFTISNWDFDWNFKFIDGHPYYEVIFTDRVSVYALFDAVTGALVQAEVLDQTDPDNTEGPAIDTTPTVPGIEEFDALYIALDHAGLQKDDLLDYQIDLNLGTDDIFASSVISQYIITLKTQDYKYEYIICYRTGSIFKVERWYGGELSNILNETVSSDTAGEIAWSDPLLKETDGVTTVQPGGSTNNSVYKVRIAGEEYVYDFEIEAAYGIVLDLMIRNRDRYILDDDFIFTYPILGTDPTEPVIPQLELTVENIKAYLKEGMTYAEVKAMFGGNDQNTSQDPINDSQRVWFFDSDGYKGTYLETRFRFPGYDTIDDWFESMGLPSDYDDTETNYLGYWIDNVQAVYAAVYNNGQLIEVLFGEEYGDQIITPPDGKIGKENAIDAALRYAGLTISDIGTAYCDEVSKTENMPAHYDVSFYYDNCKWHYLIGAYNWELLDIEKIPLD